MILLVDKYILALIQDESISRKIMTLILVEHDNGCFHFQWNERNKIKKRKSIKSIISSFTE